MMDGSVEREQQLVENQIFEDEQNLASGQVNLSPKKSGGLRRRTIILLCCVVLAIVAIAVGVAVVLNLHDPDNAPEWTMEQQEVINDISSGALNIPNDELDKYFSDQLSENQDAEINFRIKLAEINTLAGRGLIDQAKEKAEAIDLNSLSDYQLMNYYSAMQSLYYNAGDDEQANTYQDLYMEAYFKIYGNEEVGG